MPLFTDFETKDSANIFKPQGVAVLVAPSTAAAATEATLFSPTTGELTKPTGYAHVGWITTEGLSFERELELSETFGFGAAEPIIRTVLRAPKSFSFTAMEQNKTVDELYHSMSLDAAVADATTGVVNFAEPDLPTLLDWRVLVVAVMRKVAGEWYECIHYPRATVQSNGGMPFDQGENGAARGLTVTAQVDDVLGFAAERYKGGDGFNATTSGYSA